MAEILPRKTLYRLWKWNFFFQDMYRIFLDAAYIHCKAGVVHKWYTGTEVNIFWLMMSLRLLIIRVTLDKRFLFCARNVKCVVEHFFVCACIWNERWY